VIVTVTMRFIREANSVQKSTRGQHGKASRVIRRFYFCVIFGVCKVSETVIVPVLRSIARDD
jgi:hypothetical protein